VIIYASAQTWQAVERLVAKIGAGYLRQPLVLLSVLKRVLCYAAGPRALAWTDGPSEIMVDYIEANVQTVGDIVHNGSTIEFLQTLKERRTVPNVSAIGHGLDRKELYRSLPLYSRAFRG
jgi:hypothetical protein